MPDHGRQQVLAVLGAQAAGNWVAAARASSIVLLWHPAITARLASLCCRRVPQVADRAPHSRGPPAGDIWALPHLHLGARLPAHQRPADAAAGEQVIWGHNSKYCCDCRHRAPPRTCLALQSVSHQGGLPGAGGRWPARPRRAQQSKHLRPLPRRRLQAVPTCSSTLCTSRRRRAAQRQQQQQQQQQQAPATTARRCATRPLAQTRSWPSLLPILLSWRT